jgi:hypothetical protein
VTVSNSHIELSVPNLDVVDMRNSAAGHDIHTLRPTQVLANYSLIASGLAQRTGAVLVGTGYLRYVEGCDGVHAGELRHMPMVRERGTSL